MLTGNRDAYRPDGSLSEGAEAQLAWWQEGPLQYSDERAEAIRMAYADLVREYLDANLPELAAFRAKG